MTTNSFGSPLPKFDYEPVATKASRINGLPITARIAAVIAATGFAYYATSQMRESQTRQSGPSPLANAYYRERQPLSNKATDPIRLRRDQ